MENDTGHTNKAPAEYRCNHRANEIVAENDARKHGEEKNACDDKVNKIGPVLRIDGKPEAKADRSGASESAPNERMCSE